MNAITAKMNGRNRNFKIARVNVLEGNARSNNISNGWDGSMYWVEGPRGARHLCYKEETTGNYSVVF